MNFISLFKYLLLFSIFFVISCKSVEKILDENFKKKIKVPEVNSIENEDKILISSSSVETDFTKKFYLEKI